MLEVKDIKKSFGDKKVLDDVSFQTEKGEIFGLIGPNGAGKTTLINIISGIMDKDSGEIVLDGINIKENPLEVKRKIGLVPQELALMEDMNALDNLQYFGGFYNLKGKELKQKAEELLEMIGLSDRKKEKIKKFSGGMKRRLNLAVALMHDPKFLILDEPTVGVDPQSRNVIFEYLKDLNKKGVTILYTSHYMEEVEELCNRIFIMDEGREIAYGTQKEIRDMVTNKQEIWMKFENLTEEIVKSVEKVSGVLGSEVVEGSLKVTAETGKVKLGELIRAVENAQGELTGLDIREMSLTEVFLALTGKSLRE